MSAPASAAMSAAVASSQAKPIAAGAPGYARTDSGSDMQFSMSMQGDAKATDMLARAELEVNSQVSLLIDGGRTR